MIEAPHHPWDKVREEGLALSTPTPRTITLLQQIPPRIIPKILEICQEQNLPVRDIVPVGSAFRNTMLRQKTEIDLFVRFETRNRTVLVKFAEQIIGRLALALDCPYEIRYAENPYGTLFYKDASLGLVVPIDVVATIWIESLEDLRTVLPLSGMARTPFHMTVLSGLIRGLESEVRLFKFWCQKKRLYGQCAFTGFLAEMLVYRFKNFEAILQKAEEITKLRWDPSPELRSPQILSDLFSHDLIVIIDPIDVKRNAAAGIQGEMGKINLRRFVSEARENLDAPEGCWVQYDLSPPYFKISIEFASEIKIKNEDEVLGRKISVINTMCRVFSENRNQVLDAYISQGDVYIKPKRIEKEVYERRGPPLNNKQDINRFTERNPDSYERSGRLWVRDTFPASEDLLHQLIDFRPDFKTKIVLVNS